MYEMIIHHGRALEPALRCMIAEVRSDGRRHGCFLGCQGTNELVRIFDPILIRVVECSNLNLFSMTKADKNLNAKGGYIDGCR